MPRMCVATAERMAGTPRQVGDRDEGLQLPLPAPLPERNAASWIGLESSSRCDADVRIPSLVSPVSVATSFASGIFRT
jgi:hypothetical protein